MEAESRLAVAQHILENPDMWRRFLDIWGLYDPVIRGNAGYYEEPRPVTAEQALAMIDSSYVDGASRARLSIWPVVDVVRLAAL